MVPTARRIRRPCHPRRPAAVAVVAVALALVAGCGSDQGSSFREARRVPAAEATGLVVVGDRLLVGERVTGRVLEVDPATGASRQVATVDDVRADLEQGGLLGLAAEADGTVLVAYTGADGHLDVDALDLATGERTRRWTGPEAQERANGGRLVVRGDGTVVVTVGDLLDPPKVDLPDAPNGKLLVLGDDGTTTPLAAGFNNPFAVAAGPDGTLWVADNAPGRKAERLLRVRDGKPYVVTEWPPPARVPSGLTTLFDGRLALCTYADGRLALIDPAHPGDATGVAVAGDCRYAVVTLPDGGLAYAAEDAVVILAPPGL